MWSAAFDVILTTLRYLAPATILTLFWGQQSFIFKLLKHIDSAIRSIIFSSEEQKQEVLRWLSEEGPVRVDKLNSVWSQGWILCGVLDAALPGACAGHPHTSISLKHAQTIADDYLGVEPVFSRQELDSNDSLGKHQEWKLAIYLDRIRKALAKITPPVSKPSSQRTSPDTTQATLDYTAKGSGLIAAQVNNKNYFKVYPTTQQSMQPGEITILIRGPRDTYGMTVLPPILSKAQMIRQKLLGLDTKTNYTENVLPLTQGASYIRNYGRHDMNKTYYIPKPIYDIEIDTETRSDHMKIGYIVKHEGTYEISITSRGQNIVGSPFTMKASKNIISILENESFCLEDGEEIDIIDAKNDRKVVLRIVDFVTEKMLLRENGSLEKISEDEVKLLMADTDTVESNLHSANLESSKIHDEKNSLTRFQNLVRKVMKMRKVCSIFNEVLSLKRVKTEEMEVVYNKSRTRQTRQSIPDIVTSIIHQKRSSSLNYIYEDPFNISEIRDKYIIPQNISVSICTEKPLKPDKIKDKEILTERSEDNQNIYCEKETAVEDLLRETIPRSSNPFLSDIYEQNYKTEKKLGTFVATEYEADNSQNEETRDTPIKIITGEKTETTATRNNPFLEPDIINLERPKTPIFKIISGESKSREDLGYLNLKSEVTSEELLDNEFINPFFIHQHQQIQQKPSLTADFIIGAPVSLPPIMKASTPEPDIESIIVTDEINKDRIEDTNGDKRLCHGFSHNSKETLDKENSDLESQISSLQSSDSNNIADEMITTKPGTETNTVIELERNLSNQKDTWDSAYVSIDDNSSSPDSNNNENAVPLEISFKTKPTHKEESYSLKQHEISNIGPAEREIWDKENKDLSKQAEDLKIGKWEVKRPIFTPIIEESDRSVSTGMKETELEDFNKNEETAYISVAFAELNDIYQEYFPNLTMSKTIAPDHFDSHDLESRHFDKQEDKSVVESASDFNTDVMRHIEYQEGMISEVQTNATESFSASQALPVNETFNNNVKKVIKETQFGDNQTTNIVQQKKKFWDDKIRQLQSKTEEIKTYQKRKRSFSKPLKHNDSLTKRKGKHIVKNFLNAAENTLSTETTPALGDCYVVVQQPTKIHTEQEVESDGKLVEKWKKYWDEKLEIDSINDAVHARLSPRKSTQLTASQQNDDQFSEQNNILYSNSRKSPMKQELSEEVFKAFETSPKRFFGTSRKQILNKIDSFLGKHNASGTLSNPNNITHDSGLVSSRISLFHSITKTEELTLQRRKCQSLQNIPHGKTSIKSTESVDDNHRTTLVQNEHAKYNQKSDELVLKENRGSLSTKTHDEIFYENSYFKPYSENILTESNTKVLDKDSPVERFKRNTICKTSFSKSEMDIFNKISKTSPEDLDKYKSCEELPRINVKNFISLYETVSKAAAETNISRNRRKDSTSSINLHDITNNSSNSGAVNKKMIRHHSTPEHHNKTKILKEKPRMKRMGLSIKTIDYENINKSTETDTSLSSIENESINRDINRNSTYLSLSDIELEIIDNHSEKSVESSPERDVNYVQEEYKSRFKMAKQYFQSLEELREERVPPKLNECEILLYGEKPNESLLNERPQKRVKKNIKSHSMPSSEISKVWDQLQENHEHTNKPVKISEKFNVEDLYSDVMEGRLSRQGSLRGIPHKKAVLETFRSMENVSNNKFSSYDIAVMPFNELISNDKMHKNAQTFLSEYPYLPTTDPSKYHSRLDAKASGLISMKELLSNKPRRNSVPDLRLNTAFTANL